MEPPLTGSEPSAPGGRTSDDVLGRTWEMELLISGGVLFALFQLSTTLTESVQRLEPHLGFNSFVGLFLVYFIGKVILYILIASFIIHLAARGYWIGLIGLQSVFPGGPLWEQVKFGPLARRIYRERAPTLDSMIARANGFCSVIFSFAAMLVLVCIVSVAWSVALGAVAYGISTLLFGGRYLATLFFILLMGLTMFGPIAQAIDKGMGEKLAGRPARVVRSMLGAYYRVFAEGLYRPIVLTLFSNIRKKAIYAVYYFALLAFFGLFFVKDLLIPNEILSWGSYHYLPTPRSEASLDPAYYESQRPEDELFWRTPSIQDDVIQDPYIELFIPYSPLRHDPAIEKLCPGVKPLWESGARLSFEKPKPLPGSDPRAVLRCLTGIHRVSLDGKPLQPDFHFYTHPRTDIRGILAYIPTEGLGKGSHLLRVEAVPNVRREKAPRPDPYLIRFWI